MVRPSEGRQGRIFEPTLSRSEHRQRQTVEFEEARQPQGSPTASGPLKTKD
jgi:hypothetical protein